MLTLLLVLACLVPKINSQTQEKYVALSFDDGPAGKITESLLDGLARADVKATFFLCCYRMEQYPQVVQRMAEEGHEIGVHGCSHNYFTRMSKEDLQNELRCSKNTIKTLTGSPPVLLRPPGGLYNESVLDAAEKEELSLILWGMDPEDWDPAKRGSTTKQVIHKVKNGDIVLLHDLSRENVQAALEIIEILKQEGFRFCTVSQLAERSNTTLSPGSVYHGFVL